LLDEAHKEFRAQKYAEIAKKLDAADENVAKSSGNDSAESSGLETPGESETLREAQISSEMQPSGGKAAQPSNYVQ
jgi:hypothetical protein